MTTHSRHPRGPRGSQRAERARSVGLKMVGIRRKAT